MANNPLIKPSSKVATSAGLIGQLTFNEPSVALKQVISGGCYDILGPQNAAPYRCGPFASILFANPSATDAWVKFGDASVTAATGITDGLWIPAKSMVSYSSGTASYFITSANTVGCYQLEDNINEIQPSPAPPAPLAAAPADS